MGRDSAGILLFPTGRKAALEQLTAFKPFMGETYSKRRNFDPGPTKQRYVSCLSPYVRRRVLLESEVIGAAVESHGKIKAQKFIQEVYWRTYWKGWLELRPTAWNAYLDDVERTKANLSEEQERQLERALNANTEITCFNEWARELRSTGYLHNHSRMWFASIWIFTLELPWSLGAKFFLDHLLDGDPASNTLSWRWVAGIQTVGKHYVARADNIQKYTEGRFSPEGELNESPEAITENVNHEIQSFTPKTISERTGGSNILLIHSEDLSIEVSELNSIDFDAIVILDCKDIHEKAGVSSLVRQHIGESLNDGAERAAKHFSTKRVLRVNLSNVEECIRKIMESGASNVYGFRPSVGYLSPAFEQLKRELEKNDISAQFVYRDWDQQYYPHAKKGFFQFKKSISIL